MPSVELRDSETATAYLLQGLWLQRVRQPTVESVRAALEWALEIVAAGQLLPPIGFVADVGALALGVETEGRSGRAIATHPLDGIIGFIGKKVRGI